MSSTELSAARRSIWAMLRVHHWRGRFAWAGGLALLTALVCWVLIRMSPSWYRPLDPEDEGVISTSLRAQTLLAFELKRSAQSVPLGEQTWSISQDELNSFLAVNTAPPFKADGTRAAPDTARNPISDPFVVFSKGQVTFAARISKIPSGDPQGGVGSATFSVGIVRVGDKPMGLVKLDSAHAGLLPIPRSALESRMRAWVPSLAGAVEQAAQVQLGVKDIHASTAVIDRLISALGNGEPFPLEMRIDGKDIIIKNLVVDNGRFTVVLIPAHPPASTHPAQLSAQTGQ